MPVTLRFGWDMGQKRTLSLGAGRGECEAFDCFGIFLPVKESHPLPMILVSVSLGCYQK